MRRALPLPATAETRSLARSPCSRALPPGEAKKPPIQLWLDSDLGLIPTERGLVVFLSIIFLIPFPDSHRKTLCHSPKPFVPGSALKITTALHPVVTKLPITTIFNPPPAKTGAWQSQGMIAVSKPPRISTISPPQTIRTMFPIDRLILPCILLSLPRTAVPNGAAANPATVVNSLG